jgi:glycerophosphoryl diester phosphodiesterase
MRDIINIAHRGFTKTFPDNTLEAFEAAINLGVDAIECDVQETSDHKFVVIHDSALFGKDIARLPLAQIEKEKIAGKFKIPTLEETLDLCRKRVKLVVELKKVRSVDRFCAVLTPRTQPHDTVLASFSRGLLSKLSCQAPEIRRAVIIDHPVRNPLGLVKPAKSDIIAVRFAFATVELIDKVHAGNLSIFVWGCAGPEEVRSALALDIDGIASDSPDLVMRELCKGIRLAST